MNCFPLFFLINIIIFSVLGVAVPCSPGFINKCQKPRCHLYDTFNGDCRCFCSDDKSMISRLVFEKFNGRHGF
uniref:Uncharacterized protein n=1 Tax=Caenorhabditis tropicalis TaxID=1561998 RepID=A0A1I7UMV2_9PELO